MQPPKKHPFLSSSSKENVNNTPESLPKIEIPQDNTDNQEQIAESAMEKAKSASHNTKTQSEKTFDLEVEIGKLKYLFLSLNLSNMMYICSKSKDH